MSWTDVYIGLPFVDGGRDRAGVDCWGLLRLIYREVLAIELPGYDGVPAAESAAIEGLIARGQADWRCIATAAGLRDGAAWGRARPFDGLLIRQAGHDAHVGVLVRGTRFIHAPLNRSVRLERGDDRQWRHRIVGLYRHAQLA